MKLVGVIGGGNLGQDPYNRLSWSGISYFFFTEMQRQGILHRAFGAEVPQVHKLSLMALNLATDRRLWRGRFYGDPRYRNALTRTVEKQLLPSDFEHSFFQIGAMFNLPAIARTCPCFSYHDGNKAQGLKSPYAVQGLSKKEIDAGLAYEREVYHGMRLVFSMSEYLRQSFITDFGVPPEKVVNVGAGINLETVPLYDSSKNYETKHLLFIGIQFERKGGPHLLRAFKIARKRHPSATLHIVGPRELKIPAELSNGVVYYGFLRKDNPQDKRVLETLFQKASLFVMPSLYEPFGIAPLEAMVHQVPCLLTNAWALKEMVAPGETGDLCEYQNEADLAEKLIALLDQPEHLRRMGDSARSRVLDHYTWPRVVGRIKDAIQQAI